MEKEGVWGEGRGMWRGKGYVEKEGVCGEGRGMEGEGVLAAGSRDGAFERAIMVLYKIFS